MAIPIPKTLMVGLGGFGKATLRAFRRKIYENYGLIKIPALEYLVLDTDNDPSARMYKTTYDSIDRKVSFSPVTAGGEGEFINLSWKEHDLRDLYQGKVVPQVVDALKWFHPRLRRFDHVRLREGASGIRAFGKLAFMLAMMGRKRYLVEAFQHKFRRLHDLNAPPDPAWDNVDGQFTLDHEQRDIEVLIFCSTAGGTGSGIFLDVAYLIHELFLRDRIIYTEVGLKGIKLFLYLPDIILEDSTAISTFKPPKVLVDEDLSPQQLVMAGSYAALSELERYQLNQPSDFCFDRGFEKADFFVPDWSPYKEATGLIKEPNDIFNHTRAFDWAYLIGARNRGGNSLWGAEDATEMTADMVYTQFVEREQGKLINAYRQNKEMFTLPTEVFQSTDSISSRDYARHYGGFGLSKIFIGETLIQRWAAFYLMDQFITTILEKEALSSAEVADNAQKAWKQFGWGVQEIFQAFSNAMLQAVREDFQNLRTPESFFKKVSTGVNFESGTGCYGNEGLIDAALNKWRKKLNSETGVSVNKLLEYWIAEHGLKSTVAFIDALIEKAEGEKRLVNANTADDKSLPGDFTAECQEWVVSQSAKLDWMGLKNVPSTVQRWAACFAEPLRTLGYIDELNEIPINFANKVRGDLYRRFQECFLSEDCFDEWRDFIKTTSITKIRSALDEIARGLVIAIKKVLERVAQAQNEIVKLLENRGGMISARYRGAAPRTLERSLKDLLEREDGSNKEGIRIELADLSRFQHMRSRNIYCGASYQTPEALTNPLPSQMLMLETLKEGFGELLQDGTYKSLNCVWDISRAGSFREGTGQWTAILIDRGVTELEIEPTLKDYYKKLGSEKESKFRTDIKHCLSTSDSYLTYRSDRFGKAKSTIKKQWVFAPFDILDLSQKVIKEMGIEAEPSGYQGKELIILTIDDGVPLLILDIVKNLKEQHKVFSWKEAVWTRGEDTRELLALENGVDVETELFLGILLGAIWFDRATGDYKMVLERKGLEGVPQMVSLGQSVSQIISFFYGPVSDNYTQPFQRLREKNQDLLNSTTTLRKIWPLVIYYENYYFKDQMQEKVEKQSSHYFIIKELQDRRKVAIKHMVLTSEEIQALNQDSDTLCSWMHAFCEIVPSLASADKTRPDRDWFPVLMRCWNSDHSKFALSWHNSVFSPPEERGAEKYGNQLYRYLMDAKNASTERKTQEGWDESKPWKIPEYILELAWEGQREAETAELPKKATPGSDNDISENSEKENKSESMGTWE
ncbi:MAG: hypothetical protein KAV83_08160 [Desulfobacterales bacterium]|nr:hypothetical protein [Desulfobacterales bacterium]